MATQQNDPEWFSNDQLDDLVHYIIEDVGTGLSPDELNEAVLCLVEDLPSLESANNETIAQLLLQLRNRYYDQTTGER